MRRIRVLMLLTTLKKLQLFLLQLDESTGIVDTAQLTVFSRVVFDNFEIGEELVKIISLIGRTTEQDIFLGVKDLINSGTIPINALVGFANDEASVMVGKEKIFETLCDTNGELHVESSTRFQDSADDDYRHLPALVIYIVEPFTFAQYDSNLYRLVTLGLLHSYADMLPDLPEATRNSMHLQLLSLDAIMCFGSSSGQRKDEIKTLALSVFSQSHHLVTHQSSVKSLTGFGPAAAEKAFINSKKDKMEQPMKMYNRPFILASVKDKQAELGEMFGDRRENSGVLYCSYCLTKDKRFILACCTNDKGEFTETNVINVNIPNRNKRKQTSVRKFGLRKLLDFILEVISASSHPWRLIIARFGRLGHGELKAWASLLSRKSLQSYARHLKELCGECAISGIGDTPSILSVCLVSLEPDSSLRLMSDQFTLDDHFNNIRQQMYSRTSPDNSTYTHILVFPTSATTQSSQATFPSEDIDPLPGGLDEGLFEGLNDNDITGPDINDIFKWTESPQSPEGSPHRDSNSQPASPNTSFRLSSSNHGGPNRCDSMSENTDEPLQLLQQPLALGYFVSTAKTGLLPKWFWSSCPHLEDKSPVFLKSALLIHLPFVQQNSDDLLHHNSQQQSTCHPLDSNYTSDVLRFVLEGYNALSWLVPDPKYHDRRSCLPLHIQILMQLYNIVEAIL
ncbi:mediator of RNA polymerase II transcription subunit 13-like [Stegodyphus dumicola]|uniref:mediator of RNA polymerase II transcription subunit 13-like n=1 Tax=Stegodyphus dumicola TaxID=202533 RepID=UPI0015AF38FB|nr:mediator of RNA polymerase II transcription subunit 13-like [Stegodyphus dumicola]